MPREGIRIVPPQRAPGSVNWSLRDRRMPSLASSVERFARLIRCAPVMLLLTASAAAGQAPTQPQLPTQPPPTQPPPTQPPPTQPPPTQPPPTQPPPTQPPPTQPPPTQPP